MDRTLIITTSVGAALAMVIGAGIVLAALVVLLGWRRRRAVAQARAEAAAEVRAAATASRAQLLNRLDHELKNPLTALQTAAASTQQMLTDIDHHGLDEAVVTIGGASRRIARLLADLRKLVDVETREFERRPVDLAALLQLVVDDASTAPGAAERTLTVSVPQAPWPIPHVTGDEDLLHTALLNLVTNAVKYSAPGDTIEVRASDEGRWVAVDVADTGRGIPAAEQPAVWQELYRGGDVRAIPGTGMGLALVRAVTQRHDGAVELRSRPGEGTSVRILLPAAAAR